MPISTSVISVKRIKLVRYPRVVATPWNAFQISHFRFTAVVSAVQNIGWHTGDVKITLTSLFWRPSDFDVLRESRTIVLQRMIMFASDGSLIKRRSTNTKNIQTCKPAILRSSLQCLTTRSPRPPFFTHIILKVAVWVAVISTKNHKRQRHKRQSVTAKRETSQTPKVLIAILT